MTWLQDLSQAPVAAAMIAITVLFLRFISRERARDRMIWENHLSQLTKTQAETAVLLGRLTQRIEDVMQYLLTIREHD